MTSAPKPKASDISKPQSAVAPRKQATKPPEKVSVPGQNGGKREGAGRKKGIPNKKTMEVIAAAEAGGMMPLEYMLNVMRTDGVDTKRRDAMAAAAAPYVHAKLASIEHAGPNGAPIRFALTNLKGLSDAELAAMSALMSKVQS